VIESILTSVKHTVNLAEDYTPFDQDIILYINSVFSRLNQLGVGPVEGFQIEDKTPVWDDFLGGDPRKNDIKTYMYLRVRMLFDPPTTGYHVSAMQEQIKEHEWLLNVRREDTEWVDPETLVPIPDPILDGGGP